MISGFMGVFRSGSKHLWLLERLLLVFRPSESGYGEPSGSQDVGDRIWEISVSRPPEGPGCGPPVFP